MRRTRQKPGLQPLSNEAGARKITAILLLLQEHISLRQKLVDVQRQEFLVERAQRALAEGSLTRDESLLTRGCLEIWLECGLLSPQELFQRLRSPVDRANAVSAVRYYLLT